MDSNKDYTGLIESGIESILKDVIDPSKKINYVYSKDAAEIIRGERLIGDVSADIRNPIVISGLTTEQITEIATSMHTAEKNSDNDAATESTSERDSLKEFVNGMEAVALQIENIINKAGEAVSRFMNGVSDTIGSVAEYLGDNASDSAFFGFLTGVLTVIADTMVSYQDGVSETQFGNLMNNSWTGSNKAFLDYFKKENSSVAAESRRIVFLDSTPLDPGSERENLYGKLVLGCPFLFNEYADPNNRTLINSLIRDGRFLSLTPGLPKYNGLSYNNAASKNLLNQTEDGDAMYNYLVKNGIDKSFMEKDKRYYTFDPKYGEYFAYLETMLNTIWVKMGLASGSNEKQLNLFTFFNLSSNGDIDPQGFENLKTQYESSIGFFVNTASAVTESVDSTKTGFGSEMGSEANAQSDEFQRINYISGMGTGGAVKNAAAQIGKTITNAKGIANLVSSTFEGTTSAIRNIDKSSAISIIAGIAKSAVAAVNDVTTFMNTKDLGAVMQSFATTNGMKVVFPELWSDSSYSKSINLNFNFVSPYGDPLSIFKYVMVPFCCLACFAFPRQAAENGYVSPFFVRADVPGVFTTDLGLISSISWTRGGDNNLWTKDGLPRAMSVSITLEDLYPYLSMTKRVSYLSANPSYAVFLDSLTGMCATTPVDSDNFLNDYFRSMLDRVNGSKDELGTLWNKFNTAKRRVNKGAFANAAEYNPTGLIGKYSVPWMHNSSL